MHKGAWHAAHQLSDNQQLKGTKGKQDEHRTREKGTLGGWTHLVRAVGTGEVKPDRH
jgi:hypothetical protein